MKTIFIHQYSGNFWRSERDSAQPSRSESRSPTPTSRSNTLRLLGAASAFAGLLLSAHGASLINGLGGTSGFGESVLAANDDSSSNLIDITAVFPAGLNFFGSTFNSVYINNNGNITLNSPQSTYTPSVITGNTSNPIIAPFFADVDTRGGTAAATPGGTSTGSNLTHIDLDVASGILTVTWDDVGYYSAQTDKLNAFQLRLIKRGNSGDFDMEFRYESINWTTGDSSGGTGGLGGTVARAGWSSGNGTDFVELTASGDQAAILALESSPGVIVFQVRSGLVCSISPFPADLDFGEVATSSLSREQILVTNNETSPVTFTSAEIRQANGSPFPNAPFSLGNDNVSGATLDQGQSATLEVTFSSLPSPADSSALVRLFGTCGGNPVAIDIPVQGSSANLQTVVFEDPILEQCIRDLINKPVGDITSADLAPITNLNLRGKNITSIEGLQFFVNLRILDLRGNNLTDLFRTFEILDGLPLYCLYRDFQRPSGTNPANLTEVQITDQAGRPVYVVVDPTELETIDVVDSDFDTSDPANLPIFRVLRDQGVTVTTGPTNLAPAPSILITPSETIFGRYRLDSSDSGDVDGTIASRQWTWTGGGSSGATTLDADFPPGPITVSLTVTDDDGATTTINRQIDNSPTVAGEVDIAICFEISFETLVGLSYTIEYSANGRDFVQVGTQSISGTGTRQAVAISLQGRSSNRELYRVVSQVE